MLNYPITERERNTKNDMIQGNILYPETNLTANILGKDGCFLSDFIQQQGDNPPLKKINLRNYSMPESKWTELFQFTSSCKYLTHLNLWSCNVCKAGRYLVQSITSWGDKPPLQELNLYRCSIPEQVWAELLQSLSSCKQLTRLGLSGNTIGEAGRYVAQSITSWGDNPPLEELNLYGCSIPEQVWPELLQSLSSCKQITDLNLAYYTIGEAGRYIAQSVTSWGDNPLLQNLRLFGCLIPKQVMAELLQSLSSCKQLSLLALSGSTIGEAGRYLAQSITSWGGNPPLQKLILSDCSIPEQVWPELLQSLSSCRKLSDLDLSENNLTGCLSSFLSDPNTGLTSLKHLNLEQTKLNKSDIQHLTNLIRNKKLSGLKVLKPKYGIRNDVHDELLQLKEAGHRKIRLGLRKTFLNKHKQVQMINMFPAH